MCINKIKINVNIKNSPKERASLALSFLISRTLLLLKCPLKFSTLLIWSVRSGGVGSRQLPRVHLPRKSWRTKSGKASCPPYTFFLFLFLFVLRLSTSISGTGNYTGKGDISSLSFSFLSPPAPPPILCTFPLWLEKDPTNSISDCEIPRLFVPLFFLSRFTRRTTSICMCAKKKSQERKIVRKRRQRISSLTLSAGVIISYYYFPCFCRCYNRSGIIKRVVTLQTHSLFDLMQNAVTKINVMKFPRT